MVTPATFARRDAPASAFGLRPRSAWLRILAVLLGGAWALFPLALILVLSSPYSNLGWLWASIWYLPGFLGVGALFGLARFRDTFIVALVISVPLGALCYWVAPPDHARIRAAADPALARVDGLSLVRVDDDTIDSILASELYVKYVYETDLPPEQRITQLEASLARNGWYTVDYSPLELSRLATPYWRWHKGRWTVNLNVAAPPGSDWDPLRPRQIEVTVFGCGMNTLDCPMSARP